ncbi:hypothetical protein D3C86_920410 [compost metagenome]
MPPGVQPRARTQRQRGLGAVSAGSGGGVGHARGRGLVQHIAQADAARACRQRGIHGYLVREQGDVAPRRHAQIGLHGDVVGGNLDGAQVGRIQARGIQMQDARPLFRQRGVQVQPIRDGGHPVRQQHLLDRVFGTPQRVRHRAGGLVVVRRVRAHHQLRTARRRALRLLIAIQRRLRGGVLALALIGLPDQVAFQHRALRADEQPARVTTNRVAGFKAFLRGKQGVVEIAGLAPTLGFRFVALVQARVRQIARRARHLVEPPVHAAQPGLLDHAVLDIQRAARYIDL